MKTQKQIAGKVKPRRCLGFGDKTGRCNNVAGTTRTPYWCQECDDARCGHITSQLEAMIDAHQRYEFASGGEPLGGDTFIEPREGGL